jgi:hypothetical protein
VRDEILSFIRRLRSAPRGSTAENSLPTKQSKGIQASDGTADPTFVKILTAIP